MRKQLLFSVLLTMGVMGGITCCPTSVMASVTQSQTIKVTGQVVDQEGEPLIGATVQLKGTQSGVITDLDGNFTIDAPANGTLVISYVGFKDREIAINGRAIIEQIQCGSGRLRCSEEGRPYRFCIHRQRRRTEARISLKHFFHARR